MINLKSYLLNKLNANKSIFKSLTYGSLLKYLFWEEVSSKLPNDEGNDKKYNRDEKHTLLNKQNKAHGKFRNKKHTNIQTIDV